jgi:peptide/nickel transport system permease protein
MSSNLKLLDDWGERPVDRSFLLRALANLWDFMRRRKVGGVALVLVVIIIFLGVVGPYVTPYDKDESFQQENPNYDPDSLKEEEMSPFTALRLTNPSGSHFLGTDHLARDLFTRVLFGAQRSLIFGFGAASISTILGAFLGIVSAYFGGKLDLVLQRVVDSMIAIPGFLFLLLLVQTGETTILRVLLALSVLGAFGVSRVVRGATLAVRNDVYIEASRVVGASSLRILFRHIFPNVSAPIIVIFSVSIGSSILAEAGLAFLNLGSPGPSWGTMVNVGRQFFDSKPILSLVGGGALTITVLAFNLLGDSLRDALDPRLRGS